ncbi:unnamed protein product [Mytilus edulis]|uniref:EGF-like domain-containing protein n=1 Tax=Mytilus edulis TaxID=6550 RepID=A0A8S3SZ65_MYTED|nr:unnamed protein product [Mytilus edulis]
MLVAVAYLLQISNTLNPNSENVCPEKLPPINDEFRNISKDAFGVKCCPNFLERNGMCEPCPAGTYGKSCINQCLPGSYGMLCKAKCNCSSVQECHNIFGCVCKTGHRGDNCDQDITYDESTVTIIISTSIPSKAIIFEETTDKYKGSSNMDWLLYTLCIAGVIVLTAFTHLLRSYQQRKSTKRSKSEKVVWESTTTSPYTGTYDEIDENVLTDNTSGFCVTAQKSRMEAVYFVPQESTYSTTITGQVKTDYLDPVFEAELEEGEKSEDQILTCSSSKVSTGTESVRSSTSKENTHEHFHGNRVPVTIHQFIESSSGADEDTTENKCSHTYQSLQKESQISSNKYEQFQNPDSKIADNSKLQAITQFIYGTNELTNVINKYTGSDKTINSCDENPSTHDKLMKGDENPSADFSVKKLQ